MQAEFGSTQPAPLTRQFVNQTTGVDGTESYAWDYGDGSPSDPNKNPAPHVYANPSPPQGYQVTLAVVQGGVASVKKHAIGVTGPAGPVDIAIVAPTGMTFTINGKAVTA